MCDKNLTSVLAVYLLCAGLYCVIQMLFRLLKIDERLKPLDEKLMEYIRAE